MKKFKTILMTLLALVIAGSSLLVAQQTTAKIIGTVQLGDGALLPGVKVEASSPSLVGKASTVSDENGAYRLLGLTPGTYRLVFSLEGFQTVVRENLAIQLEQTLTLKITMQTGTIDNAITVTGQVPLIDVKSTAKGMTLTKEVFNVLPKGRDFTSMLVTIPGVNFEPLQGPNGGYSVDGASGAENTFYTDGMEVTDIRGGEQSQRVAFDFIEELQVKASGYQAEFGGSMGGVINVVTRAGGNELHGDVMAYYSGSALSGSERRTLRLNPTDTSIAEYITYPKDGETRIDGGFGLGGYLIKDKAWYFLSFLPQYQKNTRTLNFLWPEGQEGTFGREQTWWSMQAKLTAQPTKNLRLSLSGFSNFRKEKGELPPLDGSGSADAPWDRFGYDWPNWNVSASADYTVGNNLLISLRGGYFSQSQTNGLSPDGPIYLNRRSIPAAYDIPADLWRPANWSNWINTVNNPIGTTNGCNMKYIEYTRANFSLDVNYFLNLLGEHSWKAGVQYGYVSDNIDAMWDQPYVRLNYGRSYQYLDPATGEVVTDRGTYGYYEVRAPFGDLVNNAKSIRWALFLQDSWTIANRLTLNFGVRAESEKVPAFADSSFYPEFQGQVPLNFGLGDKIAPRFGFIYDIFGDSTLKVFGSYGIFYDVMKLAMPEGSYGGELWLSSYYKLDTLAWDTIGVNWVFPGEQMGPVLNWRYPCVNATDPDIKPMSQSEISFGVEKKLAENLAVSARFVNKHLIRVIEDIGWYNLEGGEEYVIGNPGYGLTRYPSEGGNWNPTWPECPKAKRDYTALNLSLEKRFSNNWMGGFSYTWSTLKGNYGGLDSSDEPYRNDPNVNRYWDAWFLMRDGQLNTLDGLLPTDRTHNLKVYGSYSFSFGLTIGMAGFAYSGVPVSTQFVLNSQQGYYPENRNNLGTRTPFIVTLNMYAEYPIKIGRNQLTLSINVENLTDTKSARQVYEIYNRDLPYLSDDEILAGFDYTTLTSELDNRYLMPYNFVPAINARLGIKFSF